MCKASHVQVEILPGLTDLSGDLGAKRVELLKELLPRLSRVGVLWDADGPGSAVAFKEYEAAAQAFKLELRSLEIRGPNPDFAGAFQVAKTARLDALIVVANPLMGQNAKQDFDLAHKKSSAVYQPGNPIRRSWWPNVVRNKFTRLVPARGRIRRRHPERS